MKAVILTVLATIAVAVLGAMALVYAGAVDIAASTPHWSVVERLLETARIRSIAVRAARIPVPSDLDDRHRVVAGAVHYSAHCSVCHGAPDTPKGAIGVGMYPSPPDLARVRDRLAPSELFWVVKHGIRMTGMPSWAGHGDDELWNVVAFLQRLPSLSPDDYKEIVAAAEAAGHHHGTGAASPTDEREMAPAPGAEPRTGSPDQRPPTAIQTAPPETSSVLPAPGKSSRDDHQHKH